MFFFELYILEIDYLGYFIFCYDVQGLFPSLPIIFYIVASFYLSFLFIKFALASNWFYKTICFVLFFIATFVQFSYRYALGRFVAFFDVKNAETTTTTQKIALIFIHLNLYAIVPCIAFLICLTIVRKSAQKQKLKKLMLVFTVFVLSFMGLNFVERTFAKKQIPTLSLSAFFRASTDFLFWESITDLTNIVETKRKAVKKPVLKKDFKPKNNVVLILDESIRGDHFSLNGYHRKTTPFLEELAEQGMLQNWGIAAASTISHFTYNAVITGSIPTDNLDWDRIKQKVNPTVYQYAQAMGYKTYFFDGQLEKLWGGTPDDENYIDKYFSVLKFNNKGKSPNWEIDKQIARKINKIISDSTGNAMLQGR